MRFRLRSSSGFEEDPPTLAPKLCINLQILGFLGYHTYLLSSTNDAPQDSHAFSGRPTKHQNFKPNWAHTTCNTMRSTMSGDSNFGGCGFFLGDVMSDVVVEVKNAFVLKFDKNLAMFAINWLGIASEKRSSYNMQRMERLNMPELWTIKQTSTEGTFVCPSMVVVSFLFCLLHHSERHCLFFRLVLVTATFIDLHGVIGFFELSCVDSWKFGRKGCPCQDILLMDEILHHLGWLKPYK